MGILRPSECPNDKGVAYKMTTTTVTISYLPMLCQALCMITAFGQGARRMKIGGVSSCGFQWGLDMIPLDHSDQYVLADTGLVPWEIYLQDKDSTMLDGKNPAAH